MMYEDTLSFKTIAARTTVVHTLTYFTVGLLAYSLFNYSAQFADPALSPYIGQATDPLVQASVLFQLIPGFLFGLVFYLLKDVLFRRRNGWMVLWITLIVLGIVFTLGTALGSMDGLIYTNLPAAGMWGGLVEVLTQTLLFSFITCYWVNHPEKSWLSWVLGILFAIALILPALGLLAGLVTS